MPALPGAESKVSGFAGKNLIKNLLLYADCKIIHLLEELFLAVRYRQEVFDFYKSNQVKVILITY